MIGSHKYQVGNVKNKVEAQPRKVNKKNRVIEPICDANVKHSPLNANSELICATCKKSMFDGVHVMCLLDFINNGHGLAKSPKKHKTKNIWKPTGSSKKAHIVESKIANNSEPNHTWGSKATNIPSSSLVNDRFSRLFSGTVRFKNDKIARIIGYGDYQLGNITISRVYYVEGLGHNLFFVGQFCDADLEVSFWKNTCFIHNLEGIDLLSGSRDTNLYTISLDDMLKTSPICLLSKASKTKSWLWHRRLSHLNFDDEPMWTVDRVVAPTPGSPITIPKTVNEFAIKDTENEVVRLMMFPLSLTGEAKTWLDELNGRTIETWDELQTVFISRFFPSTLFDRLLREIRSFSQHENEYLTDAWLRMKKMLRNCLGHNLNSSNSDTDKIMARMDAMTLKMDAQYKELQSNAKKTTPDLEEDDTPILADKQFGRPSGSLPSNTQPNPKGHNSKAYQPLQSRNEHVNAIFIRSGKSYNPPVYSNDQQTNSKTPINFDSDNEEDKEPTLQPKTQNPKLVKETPLPKPYKPKFPYPQRLRKEKMEAQYGKFLDMIRVVRINVPLIDVLARMPNYGKFLKELINNKHKIKQISATFLSNESSTMIQNKVPPKLGDPGIFLIPCNFNKTY
ncbi:reverse transcriptase domain-containing protein [Tanacetum coccineum]